MKDFSYDAARGSAALKMEASSRAFLLTVDFYSQPFWLVTP